VTSFHRDTFIECWSETVSNSPFDDSDPVADQASAGSGSLVAPIDGWLPPPPGAEWVAPSKPLPPLRLHHLFSLTAVVAVMLGINGPQQTTEMNMQSPFPSGWQSVLVASGVVYTIMLATAVTIVAYGIAWRRRGVRFFHHPGHWLLVVIAVMSVLTSLAGLIYRIADAVWDITRSMTASINEINWVVISIFVGTMWTGLIANVALNIYVAIKKCHESHWRWVFGVRAVAAIIRVLGDLALIAFLLRAARIDRRSQAPRDVLHWYGVWLQIAICLYFVIVMLVSIGLFVYNAFGR
jgi:hypothetical protein